jgi:catechol 2,3-dioxygenase-like lactoylglutathione lyase family enzyme
MSGPIVGGRPPARQIAARHDGSVDQRLHFVTLGVTDLGRSKRFYLDGLGWTPTLDLDEVTFFQVAPGVLLALWGAEELAADIGVGAHEASHGTGRIAFAHNVDSPEAVDAAVARVEEAGGTVLKAGQPTFFGYHAYVADPDDFRWEIAYNPSWSIDPDGTVHLGAS